MLCQLVIEPFGECALLVNLDLELFDAGRQNLNKLNQLRFVHLFQLGTAKFAWLLKTPPQSSNLFSRTSVGCQSYQHFLLCIDA